MMPVSDAEDRFSPAATALLDAVANSGPVEAAKAVGSDQIFRYLAGRSTDAETELVESAAAVDSRVRRQFRPCLDEIYRFQQIPFGRLYELANGPESSNAWLQQWIQMAESHIHAVTGCLTGTIPLTWPSLIELSLRGFEGFLGARTIWRALFFTPNQAGPSSVRLGFGYRRASRGALEPMVPTDGITGLVRGDGAVEIEATADLGSLDRAMFFALSVNGRALPLAEAAIVGGRASAIVDGLGEFLHLPAGPIPSDQIAARTDDWPEASKLGQILIDAGDSPAPVLQMPWVRDGVLILGSGFNDPRMDGNWQLLLAITPNTWQMLGQFDIKSETEGSQALSAVLPRTANDGPFGGALLLRKTD